MSPSQFRLVRISGLGVCFTLLFLQGTMLCRHHVSATGWNEMRWLPGLFIFVAALCLNTNARPHSQLYHSALLALQTVSVLGMTFVMGGMRANNYLGFLMLIVSWQLVNMLPLRIALCWIIAQTIGLSLGYILADHSTVDWMTGVVSIVFKSFMNLVVVGIKKESDERAAYAALNAEILAKQEMLAERSRAHERLRISRDLHDVMGHYLTALALNLETAVNKYGCLCSREILHAQEITRDLLSEVRNVVTRLRSEENINLYEALHSLATGVVPVSVYLNMPERLRSCDPQRAEVLIRCAQELITNAIKHGDARQVWIDLELSEKDILTIRGHDDGRSNTDAVSSGHGLRAMHERFAALGGHVSVLNNAEFGFVTLASLPMLPMTSGVHV